MGLRPNRVSDWHWGLLNFRALEFLFALNKPQQRTGKNVFTLEESGIKIYPMKSSSIFVLGANAKIEPGITAKLNKLENLLFFVSFSNLRLV